MSRRLPHHRFRRANQAGLPVHPRLTETQADVGPAAAWWFAYDASGRLVFRGVRPASDDHALTWTALEPDAATGLQYNRASHYDGSVGRWLAEDPDLFPAEDSPED